MLSIAEARSLGPILEQIVSGVAESPDIALARVWLIETDEACPICGDGKVSSSVGSRALHLRASIGRSAQGELGYRSISGAFHRVEIGDRKIGQIASRGKEMLIPSITGSEEWIADTDWIRKEGIRSFAGHPLLFRGETVGVLAVFSRATFSTQDFHSLRTFAGHAAVAIANARAFEELGQLKRQLEAENEYLHAEIKGSLPFGEIIGNSAALRKVLEQVALVAETNASVSIQGESGTGKELVARAIHERGPRRNQPFIKVNCGAIPKDLFESELFGHAKGAFTGAVKDRVGRFELAHTGDIFLDEIAELPLDLQAKLLRVLQEKQFERVGEARTRTVDVRVISATNRELKQEVEKGHFREDLFYRLTVFPIEMPPLRERKEDIPALVASFVAKSASKLRLRPPRLTQECIRRLQGYDWPGNIRELENVIERATILSRTTGKLEFELGTNFRRKAPARPAIESGIADAEILTKDDLRKKEIESILTALKRSNGKVFGPGGAAKLLRMKPTTLTSKMKALGIRKTFFPEL